MEIRDAEAEPVVERLNAVARNPHVAGGIGNRQRTVTPAKPALTGAHGEFIDRAGCLETDFHAAAVASS